MQINSYQAIQAIPTSRSNSAPAPAPINKSQPAQEQGVQVSISAEAQQLAKTDNVASQPISQRPVTLPSIPESPLTGEKLEQAVQVKKAQTHYQVASDMANILSKDNDSHMSPSTAYYLSNNEDARELVLETNAQQQAMENMQAYQEQTAALNEQYAQT